MRNRAAIHEGFMNGSRMILPRVGVGGGGGVGFGEVGHPCLSGNWGRDDRPPMDELAPLAGVIA